MARKDPRLIGRAVFVCTGSDCKKAGAKALLRLAKTAMRESRRRGECHLVRTKCQGLCNRAPVVTVQPANVWLAPARGADLLGVLGQTAPDPPREVAPHSAVGTARPDVAPSRQTAKVVRLEARRGERSRS